MLGLKVATDPSWAAIAACDLGALLADHAHCEMKAASNAMSLVARYGGMPNIASSSVVMKLTLLAQEEMEHFRRVLVEIDRRGETLSPPPVDTYASLLRERAAKLPKPSPELERFGGLIDRLLACALIEARSAERFKLLTEVLALGSEMYVFYTDLFASEARHYRLFLDLAKEISGDAAYIDERFSALSLVEAEIVTSLAKKGISGTIHG